MGLLASLLRQTLACMLWCVLVVTSGLWCLIPLWSVWTERLILLCLLQPLGCAVDSECSAAEFCNAARSVCMPCRKRRKRCARHAMCCSASLCVNGEGARTSTYTHTHTALFHISSPFCTHDFPLHLFISQFSFYCPFSASFIFFCNSSESPLLKLFSLIFSCILRHLLFPKIYFPLFSISSTPLLVHTCSFVFV